MTALNQDVGTAAAPFVAGDSRTIRVTVMDEQEPPEPFDLTGASITYQARRFEKIAPVIDKAVGSGITITDAAAGEFELELEEADTSGLQGAYLHEAEVVKSGRTLTIFRGTLTLLGQIAMPVESP